MGEGLLLGRGVVGVFYSSSRLGNIHISIYKCIYICIYYELVQLCVYINFVFVYIDYVCS